MAELIQRTDRGLYCAAGDFYVDPWRPVDRAVITHAHSDHARSGSRLYVTSAPGSALVAARTGSERVEAVRYGEVRRVNGVSVSFHPAGHILGSAQVRVEHRDEVWVVTGDYKTEPDASCTPFELVPCHTLVTESTFALPVYRWPGPQAAFTEINAWWRANAREGRASLLFGYALGKAQRLIAGLDAEIGTVYAHGAVERLNRLYRSAGIPLPATRHATEAGSADFGGSMIVAPQSANGSIWMRRFGAASTAFASGWMAIRGRRRQRAVDRGFVLSDHVDWPALLDVIGATGAERVIATHGYTEVLVRYLQEKGLRADAYTTEFTEEDDASEAAATTEEAADAEPADAEGAGGLTQIEGERDV